MNTALLRPEVQAYLESHEQTPLTSFILKGSPFSNISVQELAQQLEGKRRVQKKIPLWYDTPGVLFPPKLNIEQTSSAFTAAYKASIVSGEVLLDMTGGLGVDSYYFSKRFTEVHHLEMNEEVSAFAKANFKALQATNIRCRTQDSIDYLRKSNTLFDTIYLDPARRNDLKGKVFKLGDCVPDVVEHLDLLLNKGRELLIKTSPLLDLTAGLRELRQVRAIHIVAIENEVKEVLWLLGGTPTNEIEIRTINKRVKRIESTTCLLSDLDTAKATFAAPQRYLYEPNAAIMKSGGFHWVSAHFGVDKLHSNSHLYTLDTLIDFPGRRFEVLDILPFTNNLKKQLTIKKANITTRNFKLSVSALRKKLAIKEGGDTYLFFTTDCNNMQIVLVCEKASDA